MYGSPDFLFCEIFILIFSSVVVVLVVCLIDVDLEYAQYEARIDDWPFVFVSMLMLLACSLL